MDTKLERMPYAVARWVDGGWEVSEAVVIAIICLIRICSRLLLEDSRELYMSSAEYGGLGADDDFDYPGSWSHDA